MAGKHDINAAALAFCGAIWAAPAGAEDFACLYFGAEFEDLGQASAVSLARVSVSSPRVNFIKRDVVRKGCPSNTPACREKAYLVPGDEVVVSGVKGEFVCATYVGAKERVSDGWLPRSAVSLVQDPAPVQPQDWLGEWWSGSEKTFVIKPSSKPSQLKINGDATWGAFDPERVRSGGVNMGSIEADTTPEGINLSFAIGDTETISFDKADETDCKIQMRRLGPYLLVKDNYRCGGQHVTFSGIYRRVNRAK